MQVAEILSSPVVGVTPGASLTEAALLMVEHGYSLLPVFDAEANLTGVVTEADIACALFAGGPDADAGTSGVRTVREVMRANPTTVAADADVVEVLAVLADTGLRCVPVVSGARVLGVVSWRDLLRLARRPDAPVQPG